MVVADLSTFLSKVGGFSENMTHGSYTKYKLKSTN
jgi:hypothetical protein